MEAVWFGFGRPLRAVLFPILIAIASTAEPAERVPAPLNDAPRTAGPLQSAVLAGGCFWGVQAVYEHVKGVRRVLAGYSGGNWVNAHYEMVSGGATGHAESVQISFDPQVISYGQLLQIFFSVVHDPTQVDRQGPDVGPQYRSSIFYVNAEQRKIAQAYIEQLNDADVFERRIVTRVKQLAGFYPAEGYHQDFLISHPMLPYIVHNDLPKIADLGRLFPELYVENPVRVAR